MPNDPVVLITGGTGSLGRRLVVRMLQGRADPASQAKVIVFSRDEKKHYDLQVMLQSQGLNRQVEHVIGDVRDSNRLEQACRRATIIIHAAAMKHITHAEANPTEAVATNVGGAQNLVQILERSGSTARTVFVSTDKAVDPVNVYGMTKAIQERIFQQADINCVGVRYGNVLSSSGSLVPFFRSLAQQGKDLPVTSEEMTRFFITFDAAIDLIFGAIESDARGSIFVPHLRSARVLDIAKAFGKRFGVGHKVVGVRPGEKIHERLISEGEVARCQWFEDCCEILPTEDAFVGSTTTGATLDDFVSSGPVMTFEETAAMLAREGALK